MDKNNINTSQSLSPGDHERPPKRRRADTSNSSDLNNSDNDPQLKTDWDSESIRGEFEVIRRHVCRTEAIAIQCHVIRMKTEESSEKRRNQLEMEIVQLRKDLDMSRKEMEEAKKETQKAIRETEESRKETQEAKIAQKAVEVRLSQLMTQLEPIIGRITEMTPLIMNTEDTSTVSQSQEQADVGNNLDPKNIQFKDARVPIRTKTPDRSTHEQRQILGAEAKHTDELEEEERVGESTISSPHKSGKKTGLSGDSSSIPPDNDDTNDEAEKTSSEASEETSHLSDDDEGSVIPENEQQQQNDVSLLFGKKYSVSVDQKFLELKWDQELKRNQDNAWVCRTCAKTIRNRETIQDHVWKIHYGGEFQCTRCTHVFSSRHIFRGHFKNHHT